MGSLEGQHGEYYERFQCLTIRLILLRRIWQPTIGS